MLQILAYLAENSLRKCFKIATSLFPTGLQIYFSLREVLKEFQTKKKTFEIVYFFNYTLIYPI